MFSAYPPARLRSFWLSSTVLRLCSFSPGSPLARDARTMPPRVIHTNHRRVHTHAAERTSPASSCDPLPHPRRSPAVRPCLFLSAVSVLAAIVCPRCTLRRQAAAAGHVAFRGEPPLRYRLCIPCAPRVRVCHRLSYFSFRTAPPRPRSPVAFPYSPSRSLYYPPSLPFPFTQLYLSSLSLASSLAAPLPTPRPSRVYPLCAGGCFFRLFVLASSRAGNRRRRRRWRR